MPPRRVTVSAVILLGTLLLPACVAGQDGSDGAAAGGAGGCDTSRGTLAIGLIAPLLGDLSVLAMGMRNSADLAVDQANAACAVPGYELRLQAEDDRGLPEEAAEAASRLVADPDVVGVVGTLNSSTAQVVQPILAEGELATVSPANTNPSLTRGERYTTDPVRAFDNYFRVAPTDDLQGPFGAQYLVQTAGLSEIAVVDDGKTYGVGLADAFVAAAEDLGATIVAREQVDDQDTDFSGLVTDLAGVGPQAVYYGGEYPVAGRLSSQLAGAGLDVPVMGGDALINAEYVPLGGRTGDLGTSFGAPVDQLPSAERFVRDYRAANYVEDFETYGPLTYDATTVIIRALAAALDGGERSAEIRARVVEAVQSTEFEGVSGPVSFDEYGDTRHKTLTVYRVEGAQFVPVRTGEYPTG
ncbi:branched-chain amino acid ABC transporter substrate-binding protein [Pseudonocardia sp.]|uniref:branched-chain amino acid ABC transporter substrate-binding protein n=1 Tax=Pseudonocardia sp. TaxID=60912 RepID=UPI0026018E85|nr:branched-chain amino acid ABC transporter substrate-binding protein [Pseudonocardia sp.]